MNGRQALAKAFDQWFNRSGMNQGEVAAAGGPSTTTQTKVRQTDGAISRQTLKQIDAVTGWGPGVAARILSGEIDGPDGAIVTPERPFTDADLLQALARRLGLNVIVDDGPADAELPTGK